MQAWLTHNSGYILYKILLNVFDFHNIKLKLSQSVDKYIIRLKQNRILHIISTIKLVMFKHRKSDIL